MIQLINLYFKSRIRYNYRRDLICVSIVFIYIMILHQRYHDEFFYFLKNLSTRTDSYILILKCLFIFLFADFGVKLFFKNVLFIKPEFIKILPIKKTIWSNFLIVYDTLNIWNFYFLVFCIPIFSFLLDAKEVCIISGLQIVISLFNSGVMRLIKSLYANSKYIIIVFVLIIYLLLAAIISILFSRMNSPHYFVIVLTLVCFVGIVLLGFINSKMVYNPKSQKMDGSKSVDIVFHNQKLLYWLKLEILYILRSKRLKQLFFCTTVMLGYIIYYKLLFSGNEVVPERMKQIPIFLFLLIPSCGRGQYAWGVEANFFCGIWTKPIQMIVLLNNKYLFYGLLSFVNLLLLVPLVVMGKIDYVFLISTFIYIAGFVNGLILLNVIIGKKRLELDSSSFLNYQGFSLDTYICAIAVMSFSFGVYFWMFRTFDHVLACIILSVIGLLFLFTRKLWLSTIIKFFNMRRYSIMDGFRKS